MAHSLKDKKLLSLRDRFPDFNGFDDDRSKSRQLHDYLVRAIRTLRSRRAVPFYSIPDVSDFFGLSRSAVAKIFRELKQEGLLQSRRGAATLVTPRQKRPKAQLTGIVALPIWTPGFVQFSDIRRFQRTLEQKLRRMGYALIPIFFRQGEELQSDFIERLIYHQPDIVLWVDPAERDRNTLESLRDAGESVITLSSRPCFQKSKYLLDWAPGVRSVLRNWRERGIRRIITPGWNDSFFHTVTDLNTESQRLNLPVEYFVSNPHTYAEDMDYMLNLEPDCGFFFADDLRFAALCRHQPEAMAAILSRFTSAVTRPVPLPPELQKGLHTDAVLMDWNHIAETVSQNVADGSAGIRSRQVLFESHHLADISLTNLTDEYGGE